MSRSSARADGWSGSATRPRAWGGGIRRLGDEVRVIHDVIWDRPAQNEVPVLQRFAAGRLARIENCPAYGFVVRQYLPLVPVEGLIATSVGSQDGNYNQKQQPARGHRRPPVSKLTSKCIGLSAVTQGYDWTDSFARASRRGVRMLRWVGSVARPSSPGSWEADRHNDARG